MGVKAALKTLVPSGIRKKIRYNKIKSVFNLGYSNYLNGDGTTEEAYQALIQLYCYSNGKFTDELQKNILKTKYKRIIQNENTEYLLNKFSNSELLKINNELDEEGYSILKEKLPDAVCDDLIEFAKKTPAIFKKDKEKALYNENNPLSEIYHFTIADIMNNRAVQKLIMDPSLIEIARNYLGCEPIFDFPALWWSTSFQKEASSEAAQLYHFDMDRVKWIKIFFYLKDVNEFSGPHCYISRSHKTGTKPQSLLDRGYSRIPDEDLKPYYSITDFKEIVAKKGTIFAGDTKCWHKGKPLEKGDRLVLELEYTSSLFGTIPKVVCEHPTDEFKSFCMTNKGFSANIDLIDNK